MEHASRIFSANYIPETQDILNMRDPTKVVAETIIPYKDNLMHVYDVSGLRQDRTKWMPFFDSVSSVIFVTSLSCFDKTLIEDPSINQMRDALDLYKNICNHPLLKKTHFTLILNKLDLFQKKLATTHIVDYFKSYEGLCF